MTRDERGGRFSLVASVGSAFSGTVSVSSVKLTRPGSGMLMPVNAASSLAEMFSLVSL